MEMGGGRRVGGWVGGSGRGEEGCSEREEDAAERREKRGRGREGEPPPLPRTRGYFRYTVDT